MVIRDSLKELPWGQIWGISPRSLLSLSLHLGFSPVFSRAFRPWKSPVSELLILRIPLEH